MAINTFNSTITIASGQSLSPAFKINAQFVETLIVPATWTAANLTFQVGLTEAGTFYDLYDADGNEVVLVPVAGKAMMLPSGMLRSHDWLKLRSGLAAAPVNQAADAAVLITGRNFL